MRSATLTSSLALPLRLQGLLQDSEAACGTTLSQLHVSVKCRPCKISFVRTHFRGRIKVQLLWPIALHALIQYLRSSALMS
ncbi:hypothetical protein RIF29_39156 [Crotalaria pallida]|uniref:Uncharacterized protein n=1 Tax=Crotalaria pallida TaxID=3830 RepID=A0AAN9HPJ5_CROPI